MTVTTEQTTYEQSLLVAEKLLAPLVQRMRPGAASIPLEGPASDHGEIAECFSRQPKERVVSRKALAAGVVGLPAASASPLTLENATQMRTPACLVTRPSGN